MLAEFDLSVGAECTALKEQLSHGFKFQRKWDEIQFSSPDAMNFKQESDRQTGRTQAVDDQEQRRLLPSPQALPAPGTFK